MTAYHYIEEAHSVPYRYHKRFTGAYIDAAGVTEQRTFGLFVRDIERRVLTDVNRIGDGHGQRASIAGAGRMKVQDSV